MFKSQFLYWKTDNLSATYIVKSGSTKPHLQILAEKISDLCRKHSIILKVAWIPREINQTADEISKYFDYDDWQTKTSFFNIINQLWGPFTVDRFADNENNKTKFSIQCFGVPTLLKSIAFQYRGKEKIIT